MNFKDIVNEYKPIPFWSWNEKLDIEETKRQVYEMYKAGIGGFFMHARGGLQTEYMSEEWFANAEAAIEAAEECGMKAWAYDENGWPSGFGNGQVNGKGVKYQQKYLRMTDIKPKENVICKCGKHWFYFEINPFYVDTLDYDVISEFIKVSYEPYYKKFGNRIEGFFTDEPQISRNGIPWSFVFESEYQKRYNDNILEHLEELFVPANDYKATRVKFWKMVTDLFSKNYMKQIYDWCDARKLKITGHLACEEDFESQLTSNGACMPHYEYFHMPGVDWLGRKIFDCLTPIQLGSAAAQLRKEKILTESFALCGHNVSFPELKGIYEWQMVRGINMLCQHLEGYSIRGIRKRDYPPAMYYQQPWWSVYDKFNEVLTRTGMILGDREDEVDVLVLHPQTTAWTLFDDNKNEGLDELYSKFLSTIKELDKKHIEFHLGDETLIERHGRVEKGKLIIGNKKYSYVVKQDCEVLFKNTERLLDEFVSSGGKIVEVCDIKKNIIVDNENITYTKRGNVCYFVNSSSKSEQAKFNLKGQVIDLTTGSIEAFAGEHNFEPWGSLMIIEDGTENAFKDTNGENIISLDGKFKVKKTVENSLTLDFCDYYFDGELQEKNGYVLNICERANKLERPVKIHQDYYVKMEYIPEILFLVCETPEQFKISVNGVKIVQDITGYFRDRSFKKIEISKYLKLGENIISFDCDFKQSDKFYANLNNAYRFESEKNKLSYDVEIEAIYLVGDFSVKTEGEWDKLQGNAYRYIGDFVIEEPKMEIELKNIEKQGFPFFSGNICLEKEIDVKDKDSEIRFDLKGINAVKLDINGTQKVILGSGKVLLKEFNALGITRIRITIINNLRNLLGPHHLNLGELIHVTPSDFFKEACVWSMAPEENWNGGYCLMETGIY